MIEKAITASVLVILIVLVFYWGSLTVETQIQSSEFTSIVYSFQILANFDDGAFREGDANYVIVTITRGLIDNHDYELSVRVYIDASLVYEDSVKTKVISYKGGWLTSTVENFYRGNASEVTTSSIVLVVYTNQSGGARVFLRPRVRVLPLGIYVGRRVDGTTYRVYMLNVYVPSIRIGECYGGSPYHLVLRTDRAETYVIRRDYDVAESHTITVEVNGESVELKTPEVDSIIVTVIRSEVLFEVRGA